MTAGPTGANEDTEYLLVTEFYPPDTASTGAYMADLAEGLSARGLDVSVLTAQPHYHSGDHERQPRETVDGGVRVTRLRVPLFRATSALRYGIDWVLFSIAAFLRLLVARPATERELLVVSPPPTLPPAIWLVSRLRGWDYTYFVYSPYPHDLVQSGFIRDGGLIHRLWAWINTRVYAAATHVVTIGEQLREHIEAEAGDGFDPETLWVIHLWEDDQDLEPMPKSDNWFSQRHDLDEAFTVLYSGNIGVMHDLDTLLRAAARIDAENIRFVIIGDGTEKQSVQQLATDLDLPADRVTFLPFQPVDNLPYSLTSGDVSVVTKIDNMPEVSCKIYTSLAVGQPVLVIAPSASDEAQLVEQFDAGSHCDPGDVECVVRAIARWHGNPALVAEQGRNARRAFENHFTKTQGLDQHYRLLTGEPVDQSTEADPSQPLASAEGD